MIKDKIASFAKNSKLKLFFITFFINFSFAQELSPLYEDLAQEWARDYSDEVLYLLKSYNEVYFEECNSQSYKNKEDMRLTAIVLDRTLQIRGINDEIKNSFRKGFDYGFRKGQTRGLKDYFSSKEKFCNCLYDVSAKNETKCLDQLDQ